MYVPASGYLNTMMDIYHRSQFFNDIFLNKVLVQSPLLKFLKLDSGLIDQRRGNLILVNLWCFHT